MSGLHSTVGRYGVYYNTVGMVYTTQYSRYRVL